MLFESVKESEKANIALNDLSQERTWLELDLRVQAIATFLKQECFVSEGDHIALQIGNRVEFIEVMLAGIISGVWVTPINTHLTRNESAYILENCDAKVLFHDSDHRDLVDSLEDVRYIEVDSLSSSLDLNSEFEISAKSPAGGTMLYTSGTTGRPKGVKRNKPDTLGESLKRMRAGGELFGLVGAGPHLVTGPLYHAAPMLFAIYDLLNGAPVVIMPKWDAQLFGELVEAQNISTTHLVPTMFVRLLDAYKNQEFHYDLSSLRLVLHGAAPIAKSTKEDMLAWWGDVLVEYWGGSEAGVTTLVNSADWRNHPGTVGKPLDHFEVYVGDEQGNALSEEKGGIAEPLKGLLFCRHKQLSQVFEYYKDPAKTQKAHPMPYTFCIGDIGWVGEDGFVYLSDRESNMIISGGVNIYPAEVEQALMAHPSILDCVVFGSQDKEWGERVNAIIQLRPSLKESELTEGDLKNYLKERIAKYKIPRDFRFVDEIPRTPTGKIKLSSLHELVADGFSDSH
ncbi:MAG: AMP-binding protein [Pseudomonadales bacterium]|nr:AMP-binding protein [Pseudomonadales bacterium]